MDNKWHYPVKNDYPVADDKYANQRYPQIPCLCLDKFRNEWHILYWNVIEQCWDDEECDDYYCDKDKVEKWKYFDSIINED